MAHIWWAEILQQVIINLIRPKVEKESRKGKVKCTRVKSILIQRRRIDQTTIQHDRCLAPPYTSHGAQHIRKALHSRKESIPVRKVASSML